MKSHPGSELPQFGSSLLAHHAELLASSGVDPEVARERGYRSVEKKLELKQLGFGVNQQRVPALLIPIWTAQGEIGLYQARPDVPRIVRGKAVKYETIAGASMVLDVPPSVRGKLSDPSVPLFITEGARKADAAASMGLCCIDLLGVWNFRGRNSAGGAVALSDWEYIALKGRQGYITFDSDVMLKPEVYDALGRIKALLEGRGLKADLIYLPPGQNGSKVGLDDYLAAGHSVQDLLSLASSDLLSPPSRRAGAPETAPYLIDSGRLCVERDTRDGPIVTPLCNFTAQVAEELVLDDGCETSRAFVVEGSLDSGEPLPSARVPAARFGAMSWVTDHWGLRAIVRSGFSTRDQLREAIQRHSREAKKRRIFTHTGWAKMDGVWHYLTAGGAVGTAGFEVDLGKGLDTYQLPQTPSQVRNAMETSLRLLELAPLTATAPLWGAVFRAPLACAFPPDISLWLEGRTGSFKSTLAALFLCHWGSFERINLPGAWISTVNQLERRSFVLKDALFVVDDYVPTGLDRRELEAKASRLLRSQGNIAGRGRLHADLSERPSFQPRGLLLATGEQRPPGQSLLARTFVIELDRNEVNLPRLTRAQEQASTLGHALAGYVQWLAPQMDSMAATLHEVFRGARARARAHSNTGHLRIPEALAHLWIGLDCGLAFGEEVGACDARRAENLRAQCWDALVERAERQTCLVSAEKPTRQFLLALAALVVQEKVFLLPRESAGRSLRADQCLAGWQDDEFLYLLSGAPFQAVCRFLRDSGEVFPVREGQLRREFVREDLAECDSGRTTTTERLGGRSRRVLKLRRPPIEAHLGEPFPTQSSGITDVTGITGLGG